MGARMHNHPTTNAQTNARTLRREMTDSERRLWSRLRMEQLGFRPDQKQAYQGAKGGWQQFFANLEQILARID